MSGKGFGNDDARHGAGGGLGDEWGARAARSRALAVLRVRGRALGAAILPAAVAVVLYAGGVTGHFTGAGWAAARWAVTVLALVVLLAGAAVALVVARARPAVTPTVELTEAAAPDLHRLVRELAERLDVPAPSAIALTPDCDSWLEDRSHPAHARSGAVARRTPGAPVLVIGSPFLWWMRVAELRAVLAPVVAGTGPAADPDIAAARRFVRGLDAAVAVPAEPGLGPLRRLGARGVGRVARVLLRACGPHAAEMERGVAVAGSERAQAVDHGARIVAQEQVGLAYAGWDRLLTRVALPAWRMGRWPSGLDAGVVSALTELSRRDRLAEGFSSRLGERPACDLLEEPGAVDEAASLLAARLFHGGPAEAGPDWAPVDWSRYPEEVVDRKWRADATRLHEVLDRLGPDAPRTPEEPEGPTLARLLDHLTTGDAPGAAAGDGERREAVPSRPAAPSRAAGAAPGRTAVAHRAATASVRDTVSAHDSASARDFEDDDHLPVVPAELLAAEAAGRPVDPAAVGSRTGDGTRNPAADALAAALGARVAREEARGAGAASGPGFTGPDGPWPLCPPAPPRTGRDLLADHVTALVCCAAVDTTGAEPGLDWLDGPALLVGGERAADLGPRVLALVEDGDPGPLRAWLDRTGVRPEKPVRLM
ncbi:hypothetical protein [Streptomyces termitum]|uniref:hypothetical protein n=1 Tax=Streptomyces termitum TaxID=67368 RepID=UPI0033BE91F1